MARVAVINTANMVVNVVEDGPGWTPPPEYTAVASNTANIGDTYKDKEFVSPPQPVFEQVFSATLADVIAVLSPTQQESIQQTVLAKTSISSS